MDAPAVAVTPASIAAIIAHHGLGTSSFAPLPSVGTSMSVYLLDDRFVLRVPRNHPACIAALQSDSRIVPAARAAGVRTPRLVAFDATCALLPVPYAVYERVPGAPLSALMLEPTAVAQVWWELGHDLALLHTGVASDGLASEFGDDDTDTDPRPWLYEIGASGVILPEDVHWLGGWLDRLEPFARAAAPPRCCHGDVNASNIMVQPESLAYLALLDWGSAYWGDATWDFVPVSLRAVPFMLEGYRTIAPLDNDATAEARIVWHQVQFAVFGLFRGQERGRSWAAARVDQLRSGLNFFLALPQATWIARLP